MNRIHAIALTAIACLLTGAAFAQDASELALLQKTINTAGERCDQVANLRPGAQVDNGDVLLVVDCSDGSSHVVRLHPDDRISYFMKCGVFNPVKC